MTERNDQGELAPSMRGTAVRGVRLTAIGGGGKAVIQSLEVLILARLVNPSAFGLVAVVIIILGFCRIIASLGLADSLIQTKDLTKQQMATVHWMNLGFASLVCLLLFLARTLIAKLFGMPEAAPFIGWAGVILLIEAGGSVFNGVLRRNLRFGTVAMVDLTSTILGSVAAILVALFVSASAWALIAGFVVRTSIETAYYLTHGIRQGWAGLPSWSVAHTRPFLVFGQFKTGAMLLNYVASKSDQVLIGILFGSHQLGIYSMAVTIVRDPLAQLLPVITKVAFPLFSRVQGSQERLRPGYLKMIKMVGFASAPFLVAVAAAAPTAVPALMGLQWNEAIPVVQILAVYALFHAYGNATGSIFWAAGFARWSFYWNLFGVVVKPLAVIICASIAGFIGVPIGVSVLAPLLFVLSYFLRLRAVVGHCGKQLTEAIAGPIVASAIMGVVMLTIDAGVTVAPIPKLAIMVTAGFGSYLAVSIITQRPSVDLALQVAGRR